MSQKRKNTSNQQKNEDAHSSDEDYESQSDDGFFNIVNEEAENDSTDSEGDVEESEDLSEEEGEEENLSSENEQSETDEDSESDASETITTESSKSGNSERVSKRTESPSTTRVNSKNKTKTIESTQVTTQTKTIAASHKARTRNKTKSSSASSDSGLEKTNDEYADYDTSDEEDIRNTVGNIPMNWYDEYKHMGYDWDGKPIGKPETGDHLDNFLKRMEDPDFWRTVKDPQTGQDVVLSEEDIQIIQRLRAGKIPDATFDEYAPWIEWFTNEVMQMPLRKFPEHKRSFLPSKNEARKVSKLVHALKMGWIKTREEQEKLRAKKEPQFYMLWQTDDQAEEMRRIHKHIPAPKRHLPGHAESYNPPPEYLFDARELKQWDKLKTDALKRKLHFIPQKYQSLRQVPAYSRYIKERFLRCLDLYLCPRAIKMRLKIEPEDLVPKLPSPRDLQPFPTVLAVEYRGHSDMIRSLSTDKLGEFLLTGSDDFTVKIWEINTGRCLKTIQTDDVVRSVEWCPNGALSLVLVASGKRVHLINPNVGDFLIATKTDAVLKEQPQSDLIVSERVKSAVQWGVPSDDLYEIGYRITLNHFKEVTQVCWHGKGDYFASVMPDGQNRSVLISQISRRRSQLPFTKAKGLVQSVLFHPTKPFLFVATQRHVRIYDLMKQTLTKKLITNSRWISSMAIHTGGDNLIVGTYDKKILWFDMDLSTKPYQTLRLHGTAVRSVAYHKRYPLFASGSDDTSLIVCHGMVYNDLLQNPLIVPLKRLQNHEKFNDFGIFSVLFHPLQPWVFSAGADGTAKLYSN